jgi:tRNA A37 methylthiotransferase MiaB
MRRFGSPQSFLELIDQVRARAPLAGIRSNVIVGFPGETQADLDELEAFLTAARLDVVGVFGYSDEDGTEAEMLDGKFDRHVIAERVDHFTTLVEELNIQRAEERIGERVEVLVEGIDEDTDELTGRAAHQGPDVDGATILRLPRGARAPAVGSIIAAVVLETDGIDLIAEPG